MRQTTDRGGFGSKILRRWWVLPLVLILAAAALVARAMTQPLTVNASVGDGSSLVVRNSAIMLNFNQDMDAESVKAGFRITPLTPADIVVRSPRSFEIRPWLQPDTT